MGLGGGGGAGGGAGFDVLDTHVLGSTGPSFPFLDTHVLLRLTSTFGLAPSVLECASFAAIERFGLRNRS